MFGGVLRGGPKMPARSKSHNFPAGGKSIPVWYADCSAEKERAACGQLKNLMELGNITSSITLKA